MPSPRRTTTSDGEDTACGNGDSGGSDGAGGGGVASGGDGGPPHLEEVDSAIQRRSSTYETRDTHMAFEIGEVYNQIWGEDDCIKPQPRWPC